MGRRPKRAFIPPFEKGRLGGILLINVVIIMRPLITACVAQTIWGKKGDFTTPKQLYKMLAG
jgi:hypothetical protein